MVSWPRPRCRDQEYGLETKTMVSRPRPWCRDQDYGSNQDYGPRLWFETKTMVSQLRSWHRDQEYRLETKTVVSRPRLWTKTVVRDQDCALKITSLPSTQPMVSTVETKTMLSRSHPCHPPNHSVLRNIWIAPQSQFKLCHIMWYSGVCLMPFLGEVVGS